MIVLQVVLLSCECGCTSLKLYSRGRYRFLRAGSLACFQQQWDTRQSGVPQSFPPRSRNRTHNVRCDWSCHKATNKWLQVAGAFHVYWGCMVVVLLKRHCWLWVKSTFVSHIDNILTNIGHRFVHQSGLEQSSGRNSTFFRLRIAFRVYLMFSEIGKNTKYWLKHT